MTNKRQSFFPVAEILVEFDAVLQHQTPFDVVSIVGEGEPTLYLELEELIIELKKRTNKPVAIITNGALLYDEMVRRALFHADIVLPTMDAFDETSLKKISRPHPSITFLKIIEGLKTFSKEYQGELWLEIMLMKGINDDIDSLKKYQALLKEIKYSRLYLNTPVRPPAEAEVKVVDHASMEMAVELLGGISIELLSTQGFFSDIEDDYQAILSIIRRHPMNQFEIESFMKTRGGLDCTSLFQTLQTDPTVKVLLYKGIYTYRLK